VDWIFEGPTTLYILLLVAVAVFAALWVRDRKAFWLALLGIPATLALLLLVLDWAVETQREQIGRKLHEMAQAVDRRDAETIHGHMAATFRLAGRDRAAFKRFAERVFREGWVTSIVLWDIRTKPQGTKAEATLNAKLRGTRVTGSEFFRVKTQWTREGDQWRLAGFTVHNPYVDTDKPIDIPDLP
jgi:hypothetical protein